MEGFTFFKEVVDTRIQRLLEHITANAENKGMAINPSKTGLIDRFRCHELHPQS